MPFTEVIQPIEPLGKSVIPFEVITVDMDNDGDFDAVLISNANPALTTTAIRVLINDGHGNFTENTKAVISGSVPELVSPRQTVVADFNGDGRPDFFFADQGLDEAPFVGAQNSLMLSGPNGYTNATSTLPQVKDFSHSATAADIDGDGDLDIFVGNLDVAQGPYLLINDGTGHFTKDASRLGIASDVASHGTYTTAAVFDSDGDKDADLFLGWDGTANGSTSRLLINDGKGKFTVTDIKTAKNETFVDAKSIDVNGDGRLDLIVGGTNPDYKGGFIRVIVNQGDNKFADETSSRIFGGTAENWGYRVTLADVDGDGATDLVVTSGTGQSPVLINDGSGHFAKLPGLISGLNTYDIITPADINNDGILDFIAQRGTGAIVEYLGTVGPSEILGTVGNDALMGRDGADALYGENGNDVVTGGAGNDFLRGGEGNDIVFGGSGNDDTHGNQGNDTVSGGLGDDWVVGGKDNDLLFGGDGFDVVYGNIGNDTCDGGSGNDWIRGGQNDDVLLGQAGDDWMSGDKGNDVLTGGSGADLFNFSVGSAQDRVNDFSLTEGDRIRIEGGVPYTVRYEGSDTLVDLGNGDVMTLVGVHLTGTDWII